MASLQQQARALGDPTRHALFERIAEAPAPVGIAELTASFAFNHNAIRQHLAKLVAAGLVVEATERSSGPGRPRLVYAVDPAADARWGRTGPYERLSRLLLEVIRTGRAADEVGRRAAGEFRVQNTGDPVADLRAAMARQGFSPDVDESSASVDVVLATCPFASVATADRTTVCGLHLGIADGLVEGSTVVVDQLVANPPEQAQCRIRLRDVASPTRRRSVGRMVLRGRSSTARRG